MTVHQPEIPKRTVHPVVKIWFVLHCILVFSWSMPTAPPAVESGKRRGAAVDQITKWNSKIVRSSESPLHYYFTTTGLWQYWDMFAPNPLSIDYYISAEITYSDGTILPGHYPRIAKMNLIEKLPYERFRKYLERGSSDRYQVLWPFFAQRIALTHWKDPKKMPVHVRLIRHWRQIGPPGYDPNTEKFEPVIYYDYDVDQAKLMRDRGSF